MIINKANNTHKHAPSKIIWLLFVACPYYCRWRHQYHYHYQWCYATTTWQHCTSHSLRQLQGRGPRPCKKDSPATNSMQCTGDRTDA